MYKGKYMCYIKKLLNFKIDFELLDIYVDVYIYMYIWFIQIFKISLCLFYYIQYYVECFL